MQLQKLQRLQSKDGTLEKKMKIITQQKPKKKLSAFFDRFIDKDTSETNNAAEGQKEIEIRNKTEKEKAFRSLVSSPHFTGWTNASLF